jgi:quinol monooxygenase YgiN
MPYVRISIARPRPGQKPRLEELQAQIAAFNAKQPGCQQAWVLHPHDNSGDIARVSIWDSEAAAEHAAQTDEMMSLRSEVNLAAQEGSHTERAFSDRPHEA